LHSLARSERLLDKLRQPALGLGLWRSGHDEICDSDKTKTDDGVSMEAKEQQAGRM
jgi:hypothetical protein